MSRVDTDGQPYERNYFRVRCTLPVRTRFVRPDEIEALASEIMQRKPTRDLSALDPEVAAWLDRIEQKLDGILLQLGAVDEAPRPTRPEQVVLSGGGIRIPSDAAREVGDTLLVEFELPGPPARSVRCLGRIVGVYDENADGRELAITYHAIHPQDREAVVQHTLAVERGEQRSRSDDDRIAS